MSKKAKKETGTPHKDTFDPVLVEGKTPETVVLLLSSTEEDILIKACEAVHTYAEKGDENKVSLLGLGALKPLCQLITHNNKLVRCNAFMALGVMASNNDVKNVLKKMDAIPSIIDKLSLEDVVIHEFATLCLACLSVDSICKVQISHNKGLPPLIQLLSSPDPDVQKNSLEIIYNLVQKDYEDRLKVHELGGIAPLLELLKSDFPVIQHLVLKILHNVTTDKDSRKTFREEQGFEKLMDILSNMEWNDLHTEALQAVSNCLSDSESLHLIHEVGGLTRLMEFIQTPNTPEIQSSAVKCITGIAQSSENCKLLHEQNIEKVLVELLSAPDFSVRISTCQAVSVMSRHPASKDSFKDLGGIRAVVQLLKNENLSLRQAATQALSSLTDNSQVNAFAVYEAGGLELLVQQLCGSCPRMVANSAATLGNMAEQEVIRCSILSRGTIQALVEPLKSTNTQVLISTVHCLARLASDTEARAQLQSAGGLQPLVSLLRSYHKEVLHKTCMVINMCVSDKATAVEMCKLGALERLQEINQSVNRRCNLSELAMISLLNSNLSVKYSLTGHLASTDIITDGFYDNGKASAGQRILTLEELSMQPITQHHPSIAVNTTETEEDVSEERQSNTSERDTNSKTDYRTPRKKKADDRQKEDGGQKEETQPQTPAEKPWKMMDDESLQILIKKAKESILPLNNEREQYAALARLVSTAMGGEVKMENLHEFSWVLHISKLKFKLQSNVVPIGLIKKGFYRHRALLFKCLADCIGLSCTLVRGEYNRAWNEVLLFDGSLSSNRCSSQPSRYIVDLIHQPGNLLKANSPAAEQYQTI
ncbi:armadillo repeat-containing protein 3 isoform X2 [Cheilinus undulatus]|uniref:armadillo repeat-containing protein 3 isoform X2 n=1 Tax=Cheilinus undulatus TaxID=241271 RepID=UPI001BD45255|nr:armadillo repeat-containing protein 3 isoform X2 [Cheilinus undulatus]